MKEAILLLIDVSREQGIIDDSKTNHILICAAINQNYSGKNKDIRLGEEGIEELLYDIGTDIDKVYNEVIQSETIQVSSKYMEISEDNNISMGRCLVYEKVKKMGFDLSMEELKTDRLADILEKHNIDFSDLEGVVSKGSATPEDQLISTSEPILTPTPASMERTTQITEPLLTLTPTGSTESAITSTATLKPTEAVTKKPTMTSKTTPTGKPTIIPSATPTPRPTPSPVKNGNGSGLRGEYYDNMDLTMLKFTRVDPVINFEWGEGSPADAINVDSYSIRWTGKVEPRYSETYTFHTCTDDGVRLWVNGILLINEWKSQSPTEYSEKIDLEAGKKYEIKMEYYEHRRGASAKLMWSSLSQPIDLL